MPRLAPSEIAARSLRAAASHTAPALDLSSKASLRLSEDVAGKRVAALLDLDVGASLLPDPYRPSEYSLPEAPVPEKVLLQAKLAIDAKSKTRASAELQCDNLTRPGDLHA